MAVHITAVFSGNADQKTIIGNIARTGHIYCGSLARQIPRWRRRLSRLYKTNGSRGKGENLNICYSAQVDTATSGALKYMARTKQSRSFYLPQTFPAVAGPHSPTLKGWRVE